MSTVDIVVPPLRVRADSASIVHHLLRGVAPDRQIDNAAIDGLRRLPWPGNIWELRAMLTRLTLAETAGIINAGTIARPAAEADRSARGGHPARETE